jgi:hypothetical protein
MHKIRQPFPLRCRNARSVLFTQVIVDGRRGKPKRQRLPLPFVHDPLQRCR